MTLPGYEDVERAAARLEGVAHRTPVFTSRTVDALLGAEVVFKVESLQRAGAFKFRGAFNAIGSLSVEERARGVLTFSSGNHAGAVALASQILGCRATVVMPHDAPAVKVAATRGYGAEVVFYVREEQSREAMARELAEKTGATVIPPYDHPLIVAGQGTAARELLQQKGRLDVIVTPCGGGGLLSGTAISAAELAPGGEVWGAEPAGADDAARSLETGAIQTCEFPDTIADGARTPSIGQINFEVFQRYGVRIARVADGDIVDGLRLLWERMKLVVEPTGALGLGALLNGSIPVQGKRVGVIVSGGNADIAAVGDLLRA